MSGTRREASGSIYGDGVYVTNELRVTGNFVKAAQRVWHGSDFALDAAGVAASRAPRFTVAANFTTVIACEVIAEPKNMLVVGGNATSIGGPSQGDVAQPGSTTSTATQSCYLVVQNPAHISITHVLIAATRRSGSAPAVSRGCNTTLVWIFAVALLALAWHLWHPSPHLPSSWRANAL
jgi:hypothetical protein